MAHLNISRDLPTQDKEFWYTLKSQVPTSMAGHRETLDPMTVTGLCGVQQRKVITGQFNVRVVLKLKLMGLWVIEWTTLYGTKITPK